MSGENKASTNLMLQRMCLAFTIIFGLGAVMTGYFLVFLPVKNWNNSVSWTRVPCTIEKAEVGEHSSLEDGETTLMYQPRVLYSYQIQGTTYKSERFTLSGFTSYSTGNKAEAQSYLNPYLETASRTCLVNPANPKEAVLSNEFPTGGVLIGSLMTMVFGVVTIVFHVVGKKV